MSQSLLVNTIRGIKWSSISQVSRQILQYVSTIILVNYLTPGDFGLMAMAVIVIGFLEIFKDFGIGSAIIQKENPSDKLLSSVFWLNLGLGISISLIIFFSSDLIALIYNSSQVKPILQALSVTFLISSFSILHKSLLEKKLAFNIIAKVELITAVTGSAVAISLAISGYGVWSLVFQTLTFSFISSLLYWFFSKWKPKFYFRIRELKTIFHYSINLAAFNTINYFARNGDYFLIGKYLGDRELGHYYLAYRIMLYPIQNITAVISRVIFPSFARIQNDDFKLSKSYQYLTHAIALLTFPMMSGLGIISFNFTDVFFSSNWNHTLLSSLILILAPVGAMQSIISTVGNIYQIKGKTDWMFRWSLFYTAVTVTGFIIGLKWGAIGVASAYLITNSLLLYPVFAFPLKLIKLSTLTFFKSFIPNLTSVILMCGFVYAFSNTIGDSVDSILNLFFSVLIGIISYICMNLIVNKKGLLEIKMTLSRYKNELNTGENV